jgi:hypothetical protein
VSSLEPLRGMPLTELHVGATAVKNLEPLRGMPLARLTIDHCDIEDLTPLEDLPLQHVDLTPKLIKKGLDVLRNHKTVRIIQVGYGNHYSVPEFWKLHAAGKFK